MHLKPFFKLIMGALFVGSAYLSFAQVVPSASENRLPLAVGAGLSSFNPDWAHGRMLGGTLWADYTPNWVPQRLHGIGLEVEARDLNYHRSPSQPANLREDIASGGVIYSWRHFHNFRPYGKFLMGFGNTDYEGKTLVRGHDSRTITSLGGGAEFRVFRHVWVRADYEYQSWPDFFKHTAAPSGRLNPQGFTLGAMYNFNRPHFR